MSAIPISTYRGTAVPIKLYKPPTLSEPQNYTEPDSVSVYTVAHFVGRTSETQVSFAERYSFTTYDEMIQYEREQSDRNIPTIIIFWFDHEHGVEIPKDISNDKGRVHRLIINTWKSHVYRIQLDQLHTYLK